MKFDGKQVLITGTSGGIGQCLAKYFYTNGATVYAISRHPMEIEYHGIRFLRGGIGDLERIEKWLLDEGGKIDILINNAGIICYENLLDISREQIDQLFSTNVFDTFLLSRLIANMMIMDKRKGIIINTLSFAATIPSVGSGFYGASKATLVSLTKTMAAEWAPYGIRVNGYSPGVIETKMTESALKSNRATLENAIALHSIGNVSDVIGAVSFLASDESKYITGINLDVSGGKFIVQNSEMAWKDR